MSGPRAVAIAIVASMLLGTVSAQSESAGTVRPPAFTNSRYGEDYGYLRDPGFRTADPWEAFKFVPLDAAAASFATFGVDLRLRYEGFYSNLWGQGAKPKRGLGLVRIMPYVDLHLGSNLRLFGQSSSRTAAAAPFLPSVRSGWCLCGAGLPTCCREKRGLMSRGFATECPDSRS